MDSLLNSLWWLIPIGITIAMCASMITTNSALGKLMYIIIVACSYSYILKYVG